MSKSVGLVPVNTSTHSIHVENIIRGFERDQELINKYNSKIDECVHDKEFHSGMFSLYNIIKKYELKPLVGIITECIPEFLEYTGNENQKAHFLFTNLSELLYDAAEEIGVDDLKEMKKTYLEMEEILKTQENHKMLKEYSDLLRDFNTYISLYLNDLIAFDEFDLKRE